MSGVGFAEACDIVCRKVRNSIPGSVVRLTYDLDYSLSCNLQITKGPWSYATCIDNLGFWNTEDRYAWIDDCVDYILSNWRSKFKDVKTRSTVRDENE